MPRASLSSVVAACAVAALVFGMCATSAWAGSSATARSITQQVTSGSWGAVATTSTSPPFGTGPYSVIFTSRRPLQSFFTIGNTGTLNLIAASFTVAASPNSESVVVEACSTSWDEPNNVCVNPGTITTVVSTTTSPATSRSVPVTSGSRIRLRATLSRPQATTYTVTVTVGVTVARSQVRSPSTTNG